MSVIRRLVISELAHNGSGVGFIESPGSRGKTVFVPDALPGQIVDCEIIREKKSWSEARLIAVTDASGAFLEPHCCHSQECGGCPIQQLPYTDQLFWKERLAREALIRIGGLDRQLLESLWKPAVPSPFLQFHRNKLELAFGRNNSGEFALGFRSRRSHAVFNVRQCALLDPEAQGIVDAARNRAQQLNLPDGYLRHLILRKARTWTDASERWHALLITSAVSASRGSVRALGEALLDAGAGTFFHEERFGQEQLATGDRRVLSLDRKGRQASGLVMELGGLLFEIDPASFFQVNSRAAEKLCGEILALDQGCGPMLDLYCGSGAPGQVLARRHASCTGIEADRRAVKMARKNARRNGIRNSDYHASQAADWLAGAEKEKWELCLADPPRQGLGANALASLNRLAPDEVIYVSCDPATLARDARLLSASYSLAAIQTVDLFPHTVHIECASRWLRK